MGDVVNIVDRLKDKSEAYSALREIAAQIGFTFNSEKWSEYVMTKLWDKGFQIVPRDMGSIDD
jgi:predicted CoA-binding protein